MDAILEGIRVLDFGRYIAGPYCAALLADFGADVIRIEKREGSEDRYLLPVSETGDGALFLQMNRNKRCLTLDPMTDAGRDVVRRLVARADVVVVNLPPATTRAMGLDYASLCEIRPDIILTTVSAFGPDGPYRDRVGFDGVGQAMSGSTFMSGYPDAPARSTASFVDFTTALSCAYGTALALLDRSRTGRGRVVEASLLRSALNVNNSFLLEQAATHRDRIPTGNRGQSAAPADLYRTEDGWILVQVIGAPLFARCAKLLGAPEWLDDPRLQSDESRAEHANLIGDRVSAWCAQRTSADALRELERARIPSGPVYSPQQVLDDPHVRAAELLSRVPYPGMKNGAMIARSPVTLSGSAARFERAPLLAEHTGEILAEAGYTAAEIETLKGSGIV